jgi:hypothetical protein
MTQVVRLSLVLAVSLFSSAPQAEIVRSAESGFTVSHTVTVPMTPPAAWSALADIGKWWSPDHTFSGDPRNLTLDPYVQGCFCEKLGMYGGVRHMTVIFAQPPKLLRMSGALGPLQEFAVNGAMTWSIDVSGGGSKIALTYSVGGYADRPLSEWAPLVDSVLGAQIQRLARYISTGNPGDAKSEPKRN